MLPSEVYSPRRRHLMSKVPGPLLLLGNGERARNLPMNKVKFRQDSHLLYYAGWAHPDSALLLEDGRSTLFVPAPADDDALWHGVLPSLGELRDQLGVDDVVDRSALDDRVRGRRVRTLAVGDEEVNRHFAELLGVELRFGKQFGDEALADAIIAQRLVKDDVEVAEMRRAARATEAAFDAVMRGTSPGGHERVLAALFDGMLAARGLTNGYDTILSQRGEILHNHDHGGALEAGRLLLLDGGGELPSGYGVDITRTWPVSGRFTSRQKSAYQAVLAAQLAAIDVARVGVRNRVVHDTASRVLADWLVSEGLCTGTPDDVVAEGAHAAFFPHGIGHHLGMDVHDLEAFGDRPSYPPGQGRPTPFGTRYLRMDLPLQAGWIITVEPGFYVAPAIIEDRSLDAQFRLVNKDAARAWYGFGGIRIEDDVLITNDGPDVLTAVPKAVADVEAIVGSGPTAESRFGV
jgi:Xaa-Pro aminopeptidase